MRRNTVRWLLSPVTQWRAVRFTIAQRAGMTVEVAWILMRLRHSPDEAVYVTGASGIPKSPTPGVRFDKWANQSDREKKRRSTWLATHRKSPFQLLRVDSALLERAGIEVTDWGAP